jgi:hypothetical protein
MAVNDHHLEERMRSRDSRFWLCTLIMLAGGVGHAGATTFTVAASGIDAVDCGTKAAPCRSLSRAIANAAAGDKIVVGPGRYGDLDADGALGEPGEEAGAGALVTVDKTLTIESLEGAATTLIDGGGANLSAVVIAASGVRFGKAKKGFTVSRSGLFGVFVDPQVTDVTVSGVRAVGNQTGFGSKASGLVFRGNVAEASDQNGFALTGNGVTITGCRATGNTLVGFSIGGASNVLKANAATANGDAGFDLKGAGHTLTGSIAAGNQLGLRLGEATDQLTLVGNSFVGNVGSGVLTSSPDVTLVKTNIFGNGNDGSNCGTTTVGAGTFTLEKVCFGAASGPGDDPADATCGIVSVVEIVEKAFKITVKVPL